MKHNIPEEIFQRIRNFLSEFGRIHTENEAKLRKFLEGIFYLCRTGCQIRLLPKEYGNCFAVYQRFLYWKKLGIWKAMFEYFKEIDGEYFMADSTVVRANSCAAGYYKDSKEALGRSRGGFSTKIHTLTDALGNPVKFILSPGNEHDITRAEELTKKLKNTSVLADKGYDSFEFVEFLKKNNCTAIIPSRSNIKQKRETDRHFYKERHLIETFFNKMKFFRRVFSRYCKSSSSFLAFLHFVGALIWLR